MARLKICLKYKKDIITYLILFCLMLLINGAKIVQEINPFGFSFLFSLVYLGKNSFVLCPMYFVSSIAFNFSIEGAIIALGCISVCLLLSLLYKCIKKPISMIVAIVFLVFSQVGYVYFNITNTIEIFKTITCLIIGILFFYVCTSAFGAVFFRGLQSRFTLDESICFSVFLIAISSGLQGINIFGFFITNPLVVFILLLASKTITKLGTIYLSALIGIGVAIASGGISSIAIFVVYGIICTALCDKNRILLCLGVVLTDITLGLFLNAYAYYSIVNIAFVLIICILFLFLPQKVFDKIKGFSYSYDGNLVNEFIVAGQKELLKQKLNKLGDLYKQMQLSYRNLSVGEIDRDKVCGVLSEELMAEHCKTCPKYNSCLENNKIKEGIHQLFEFGLEKTKVTLLDANNMITTNCISLSSIINEVNQSIRNYFDYEKKVKIENSNKMLVAEQLGGTSDIFKELSLVMTGGEKINEKMSKMLIDELTINKVVVNEVVVLDGDFGVERVIIVVRNSDVLSEGIKESLNSVFRLDFINVVRQMTRLSGWSVLCFVPAPKYSLSVGFASESQGEERVSGDTYSITKLSETKMLFAIADGMGHGKRANEISANALSLVENFYKSGFSSQTVISSVNKILLPSGEENFTTLDVCVVDTSNGTADFIKIGSSVSIIKGRNQSSLVSVDSLPLGIVGSIVPTAQKKVLSLGDVIVIASDGVVDSFDNIEDYLSYVNNEVMVNSQMLADNILEEVKSREKEHKDDKTIITIKLNQFFKTN